MNNKWSCISEFEKLLEHEEVYSEMWDEKIVSVLYAFYHYFNADTTKIDELLSGITVSEKTNIGIDGVFVSAFDDNSVDFLSSLDIEFYRNVFVPNTDKCLKVLATQVANTLIKNQYLNNDSAISIYTSLNVPFTDDCIITVRILCDFELPPEEKIHIQQTVANYQVKSKNIKFEMLLQDDIQQEIDDIENPKEYVPGGELVLTKGSSICFFGEEKSFVSTISAKSLKKIFLSYGSRGLFDSNLRFFVSSKKIDPKIIDSIQNESENFCYYNNGIIVTCDDYSIKDNKIILKNFSIVNGGQTTNLIGRTDFAIDFPVICKVIRNKYPEKEKKIVFLSKVAEASNTQKPINAKDLIANRKEQRLLKMQFENIGIFLKVKRGEKIDKSIYSKNWQNASNDEIAQFLYSVVYQSPGSAKNSKSKLLDNEKTYNRIFGASYDDGLFLSLQHLKVAYSLWNKRLKKTEKRNSVKYGLAQNASLMCLAVFGLMYKAKINNDVKEYLLDDVDFNNTNEELKLYIQQNDIGITPVMKKSVLNESKYNTFFAAFESIFGIVLIPAYEKFKRNYPNYSYSHFTKSDNYYYSFVIPQIALCLRNESIADNILSGTLSNKVTIDMAVMEKERWEEYKPGLEQELIDYRREIYRNSNRQIQAYEVITNRQLANVVKYLPKNEKDLARYGGMREEQIRNYGDRILDIIDKYASVENLI